MLSVNKKIGLWAFVAFVFGSIWLDLIALGNDGTAASTLPTDSSSPQIQKGVVLKKQGFDGKQDKRRSASQTSTTEVKPDWIEVVEIDGKEYEKIYMTADKLVEKFGTGLNLDRYTGYYYQAVLPDIHRIAGSLATDSLVDSVRVIDSLTALVYITKDNYRLKYGEESLDPEDGEYPGYYLYKLLRPAPYLPIYPSYPEDKLEIVEQRTPYSRTFLNADGSYTTVLTARPTSYSIPEGDKVKWADLPPDEPVSQSTAHISKQGALGPTYYAYVVEIDNDMLSAYNYVRNGSENFYSVVGAGKHDTILLPNHLYQRSCTQFSTSSIPSDASITEVVYRTYIADTAPEDADRSTVCVYDYEEIWPLIKNFTHKPQDEYRASGSGSDTRNNNLFDDCWDGSTYYDGGGYIWDRGDGYVYANFNSAGVNDFKSRRSSGWYAIGLVDKAENNENPDDDYYWEGIAIQSHYDQLQVTYCRTPSTPSLSQPSSNATCVAYSPTYFDWGNVSGAVQYEINISPGSTYTTSSSNYSRNLSANTPYTWKVRAKNSCGTWGDWSGSRSFTTTGKPGVSSLSQPSSNATCVAYSPTPTLSRFMPRKFDISGRPVVQRVGGFFFLAL